MSITVGEPRTAIEEVCDLVLELEFNHPEIVRVLESLDGNIVLKAGDTWYAYQSKEPAKPSKLNPYRAS